MSDESLINFERTDAQLEYFFLRCLLVAGKNAAVQQRKLDLVLGSNKDEPLEYLFSLTQQSVTSLLKGAKTGQYGRISKTIIYLKGQKLRGEQLDKMTVAKLEEIPGVGPKTARFFVAYSRPNQNVAILDTHILAWMRDNGHPDAPRATPAAGQAYALWETKFLWKCTSMGTTPVELDNTIWKERRK